MKIVEKYKVGFSYTLRENELSITTSGTGVCDIQFSTLKVLE
jgi:hypothetical protein